MRLPPPPSRQFWISEAFAITAGLLAWWVSGSVWALLACMIVDFYSYACGVSRGKDL